MKSECSALKLSDYTPQPVWNYALPDGWSYNGNPVFYNGTVIISAVNNATTTGGLWAIDAQTHIISLVSDLAVTLLQFSDAVLEGFLQVVQAIVDALFDLLNTPLDIPVLSDLYSMITNGSQLTILDLCCVIVSIPATIITQALSGGGATQRLGSAQGTQEGLLAGALAIYTIIDVAMNLDPETPPPMKLGYAALCLIVEGLSFPSDLAVNTGASYVYWVLSICPGNRRLL